MTRLLKKTYYSIGATVTMSALSFKSGIAMAQNNFSTISDNITTSLQDIPGLVGVLSMIMGLVIGALGIFKIKDHVESPDQTELKDGAIRLAAGGALLSLPFIYDVIINNITAGSTATAPSAIQLNKTGNGLL